MGSLVGKGVINDEVWKKIQKRMKNLAASGPHVKIGVFSGSGEEPNGISLVELAAIHEFGSPAANIPERSFLRSTFAEKKAELAKVSKKLAAGILTGKMGIDHALDVLGQWGVSKVKGAITEGEGIPPPNAPSTIAKKGSSRPLVNHGRLLNSITYQKVGKGDEE